MDISGRIRTVLRSAALSAGLGIIVLGIVMAALWFLIAACFIWLIDHMSADAAAAILGGALLVFAVVVALIGGAVIRKSRRRYPSLISEFGGTIGLAGRLVGMMVRKDPKKALILSIIAGALAEYIASDRKK